MYKGGGSVANGSTAEGSVAFSLLPIEARTTAMMNNIINKEFQILKDFGNLQII